MMLLKSFAPSGCTFARFIGDGQDTSKSSHSSTVTQAESKKYGQTCSDTIAGAPGAI